MRSRSLFAMLFALSASLPSNAIAAEWSTLVQPIGTRNDPFLLDPAVLNLGYPAGKGPWEANTMVTSIRTTATQFFVRFYNPTAQENPSNQEGGWVMRASEVRGLTPEQVRDRFALPNVPTMMTLGLTNSGEALYTGLAGPIAGWGNGGGQQSQRLDGPYTTFFNGQAVTASTLYYPSLASTANGRAVGAYLMAHLPGPYSDMESAYDSLDVLYNPASASQFDAALLSIGPERFDNLLRVGYDAAMLHSRAIGSHLQRVRSVGGSGGGWMVAVRDFGGHADEGFEGSVGGLVAGYDHAASGSVRYGISAAWLRSTLDWNTGGEADADSFRGAAFASVDEGPVFMQFVLSGGAFRARVSRYISIGTFYQPSPHGPAASPLMPVARMASSTPSGWDADVTLRAGSSFEEGEMRIVPVVEAGCLRQMIGAFPEGGAGSLGLQLHPFGATTAHAGANLRIERPVVFAVRGRLVPYAEAGWNWRHRLDARGISASMNGWADTFTVTASEGVEHYVAGALGLTLSEVDGPALFLEGYGDGSRQDGGWGIRTGLSWGW